MAIYTIRGTADYKAQWTETPGTVTWSTVDDSATEPSTPDTSDYITSVATPTYEAAVDLSNVTLLHGERIAGAIGWMYGHASASNTTSLYFTDATGAAIATGTVQSSTSDAWTQNAIDGRSLDQTKLTALGLGVSCNGASTGSRVYSMYAEVLTIADDYGKVIYDDRPAVWWRCNDASGTRVRDWSGNGRSGTTQGTVDWSFTQLVPNGVASSLRINRSGSQYQGGGICADNYKPYTQGSRRSAECWFMSTDTSGLALTTFGGDGTATFGPHPTLEWFPVDDYAYSHFYTRVSTFPVGWYDLPVAKDTAGTQIGTMGSRSPNTRAKLLEKDTIHHMVWCYDDTRLEYWLYLDGVLVGKATSPGTYATAFGFSATDPGNMTWGYRGVASGSGSNSSTATETFVGYVAEIAMYERILSHADVLRHYQAGRHSFLTP